MDIDFYIITSVGTTTQGDGAEYHAVVLNAVDQLSTVLTSMSSFFLV